MKTRDLVFSKKFVDLSNRSGPRFPFQADERRRTFAYALRALRNKGTITDNTLRKIVPVLESLSPQEFQLYLKGLLAKAGSPLASKWAKYLHDDIYGTIRAARREDFVQNLEFGKTENRKNLLEGAIARIRKYFSSEATAKIVLEALKRGIRLRFANRSTWSITEIEGYIGDFLESLKDLGDPEGEIEYYAQNILPVVFQIYQGKPAFNGAFKLLANRTFFGTRKTLDAILEEISEAGSPSCLKEEMANFLDWLINNPDSKAREIYHIAFRHPHIYRILYS